MARKQPGTLEELAFEAVSSYITSVGYQLMGPICTYRPSTFKASRKVRKVNFNFNILSDYFHCSLPHVLAVKITDYLLKGVKTITERAKCTRDEFMKTGDLHCRDIAKELIFVSISPYLTKLNLQEHVPFIRKVLSDNLNVLVKLEHFTVELCDDEWVGEGFTNDLSLLKNLVSFKMINDCTDEIVHVICSNCSELKCLNITGSCDVTNDSVDDMLRLHNWEELQLSGTSLTKRGFVKLWSSLPTVYNQFQVTSFEATTSLKCLPMKKLGTSVIKKKQIKIIAENYPFLTHLTISVMKCDLSILNCLNNLEELKLSCGNFVSDNLKGLLEVNGRNIKVLDLLLFQNVDLMLIGRCCSELRVLNLRSCSLLGNLPDTERTSLDSPFQKLYHLTFYVQTSVRYLEYVLLKCINIKTIVIGLIEEVNDNFLTSVLSKNILQDLEKLEIYFCKSVSIKFLWQLLSLCPKLSTIKGLETWKDVTEVDLVIFREQLIRKNLSVNTLP